MVLEIDPITGVEYDTSDTGSDLPDPPRAPLDGGPMETALRNYRIRFDWDEPKEDYDAYMDDNEGLKPGQSHAVKYKIVVQNNSSGSWQPVETKKTRNTYYVFHAKDGLTDSQLLAQYRALIYSIDADGDESASPLNTNGGTRLGGGDRGGATEKPSPVTIERRRRVKGVLVRWDDVQDDITQEPVKYKVYASSSPFSDVSGMRPAIITKSTEILVTRYWNGGSLIDFDKNDAGTPFYFRVLPKNAVGIPDSTVSNPNGLSNQVTGSPKRAVTTNTESNGTLGDDEADTQSIIAERFQAGLSGDRILINDPDSGPATIDFLGSAGRPSASNSTRFRVTGSNGNVAVCGGIVDFSGTTLNNGPGFAPGNGLIVPRLSDIGSNAVKPGSIAFRTSDGAFVWYNGTNWKRVINSYTTNV